MITTDHIAHSTAELTDWAIVAVQYTTRGEMSWSHTLDDWSEFSAARNEGRYTTVIRRDRDGLVLLAKVTTRPRRPIKWVSGASGSIQRVMG